MYSYEVLVEKLKEKIKEKDNLLLEKDLKVLEVEDWKILCLEKMKSDFYDAEQKIEHMISYFEKLEDILSK